LLKSKNKKKKIKKKKNQKKSSRCPKSLKQITKKKKTAKINYINVSQYYNCIKLKKSTKITSFIL